MNNDWWDFIYPGYGLVEFRYIGPNNRIEREWTKEPSSPLWVATPPGVDIYYGVVPRATSGGGKAEDCWPTTNVLWADVDAKAFCPDPVLHSGESRLQGSWDDDKANALNAILAFPLAPSAIVDSGHGYHLYFKLDRSYPFAEAQYAMRGIAKWVNGDATYDQPRILRVPGTTNWKYPDKPVPVRLLKLDTLKKYLLSDFAEITQCLEQPDREPVQYERREDAADWLKDLINTEPAKGTRSETEFRAIKWLVRYGYSVEDIVSILMNSPVGAKAQEKGERWAEREVQRVVSKA